MLYILSFQNPYCLVIININFEGMFTPRNGGQADLQNIEHLLKNVAGFKSVHTYSNQERIEILQLFDEIAASKEMST